MFFSPTKLINGLLYRSFSYQYNGKVVQCGTWLKGGDVPVRAILFLGTVQVGKLPAWIADKCPVGTLVVQGAPHWLSSIDGSDTSEFVIRFTSEACDQIFREYKTTDTVSFLADSQAASALLHVLARASYIHKIASLVLIQPLGLTTNIFIDQQGTGNVELFKERVNRNLVHQLPSLLSDLKLVYNHLKIFEKSYRHKARSDAQYGSGLIHDSVEDLSTLISKHVHATIVCGERDEIFPPQEIQASLDSYQLQVPIIVVKHVPHSPLATSHGTQLLNKAFEYV